MKEQMEHVVQGAGLKASVTGGAVAVLSGMSSEWVIGLLGVLVGLLGVLVTRHYARKRDRREARARDAAAIIMLERETRAKELHRAQLAFFQQHQSPAMCDSMDMAEAQALGIDTADWPDAVLGVRA